MHETLLKCKCDPMHKLFRSFEQNPTQIFCKNLINFEKSQNLSKTPKSCVKRDEMHDQMREIESYQRKKMILKPKIEWGRGLEWEKGVWEGEESERVKRDQEKWERNCAEALYWNPRFSMDREVSRGVEI